MKEYAFGIDLGGTTAKIGLFKTTGELLEKWEVPTDTSNAGEHILKNLAAGRRGRGRARPCAGQPHRAHHLRKPRRLGQAQRSRRAEHHAGRHPGPCGQ